MLCSCCFLILSLRNIEPYSDLLQVTDCMTQDDKVSQHCNASLLYIYIYIYIYISSHACHMNKVNVYTSFHIGMIMYLSIAICTVTQFYPGSMSSQVHGLYLF